MEQAEKRHGRYRPGAGRKSKYGVKTVVMRIPENRVQEVEKLIGGGGIESVTESKVEPIEDIRRIVERWGEKLVPHQNANGQVKQPRWARCWEMCGRSSPRAALKGQQERLG
jgi:hypothetical protein